MILAGEQVERFAVVDVETTGFAKTDRIVEVAVVMLSSTGELIDEWDTLVNPERDVGPTHVHRVTASMVSAAPTFAEVSATLARRLDGAVLVAHNLPFDSQMLANEYERVGGALDPGRGVCTYRLTGQTLEHAADAHGITLEGHHRALADARAAARLLTVVARLASIGSVVPAAVEVPPGRGIPRTLRRDHVEPTSVEMPYLARLSQRAQRDTVRDAELIYMEFLDWVLADLVITAEEQVGLDALAGDLGLSRDQLADLHRRYLESLLAAALRDGMVDDGERRLLERVAGVLGADPSIVEVFVADHLVETGAFVLAPATRVCFTGSAVDAAGVKIERAALESQAHEMGLEPVKNVTKKGCDLVVAADPTSQSGKARKAREYGIPITSVEEFISAEPGARLTTM